VLDIQLARQFTWFIAVVQSRMNWTDIYAIFAARNAFTALMNGSTIGLTSQCRATRYMKLN